MTDMAEQTIGKNMKRPVSVKVCGLTSAGDAQALNRYSVDYAGMVLFYEKSKRNVSTAQARKIIGALKSGIHTVAVTVSPDVRVLEQVEAAGFDFLQVHAALTQEVLERAQIPIIRAVNMPPGKITEAFCDEVLRQTALNGVSAILLDASVPGSGNTLDWRALRRLGGRIKAAGKQLFLAGGLRPDNVQKAIRQMAPDAVDVSSGVEYQSIQSGHLAGQNVLFKGKDPQRIRAFVEEVRQCSIFV